jgi:hypothetical protein
VVPRAGLDDVKKRKFFTIQGLELRLLSFPARRQSLHQVRYPVSSRAAGTIQNVKTTFFPVLHIYIDKIPIGHT